MKLLRTWYQPIAEVEFTWAEVENLILFSETHYDYKCKEMSLPGGVLLGMRNMFNFPLYLGTEDDKALRRSAKITYSLDGWTADLLTKVAQSDPVMGRKLGEITSHINDEWRKVNKDR
jgi:hypothetical protein